MEGLRWWLLLFGLLVIAGVYLYSRREKSEPTEKSVDPSGPRVEPTLGGDDFDEVPDDDENQIDSPGIDEDDSSEPERESGPQKIVTLRLVGHDKKPFQGDELILSMRGIGLASWQVWHLPSL